MHREKWLKFFGAPCAVLKVKTEVQEIFIFIKWAKYFLHNFNVIWNGVYRPTKNFKSTTKIAEFDNLNQNLNIIIIKYIIFFQMLVAHSILQSLSDSSQNFRSDRPAEQIEPNRKSILGDKK